MAEIIQKTKIRVFLCHAAQDKPIIRELYAFLKENTWIDPWFDEKNLLPGQDWDIEINKAIRKADVVIICLSSNSVAKEGYVQKEFKRALSIAEEKPEGTIYLVPVKLDKCEIPYKFQQWQWLDYFNNGAKERLLESLRIRATSLGIQIHSFKKKEQLKNFETLSNPPSNPDLYKFINIPQSSKGNSSYTFWISKYPVTNQQFQRFLNAPDYENEIYWKNFPKYNEYGVKLGYWGIEGWKDFKKNVLDQEKKVRFPLYWHEDNFGIQNPDNPIVGISWFEANAYAKWLFANWNTLIEYQQNPALKPNKIRLPLNSEWVFAAGGDKPSGRHPWDRGVFVTFSDKKIIRYSNVKGNSINHTTAVNAYPQGASPFGVMDMGGNVREMLANNYEKNNFNPEGDWISVRHGSWNELPGYTSPAHSPTPRGPGVPYENDIGFRIVAL